MQTISSYLKTERESKRVSLPDLENKTKIKKLFIVAIENGNWESLPEYPVVVGFVRSIATALGSDTNKALALLRRDYPPKQLKINPKPDISKSFVWGPKATFLVGVGVLGVILLGYLGYQYISFTRPPQITIYEPQQEMVVKSGNIKISGKTTTDSTVVVNNQPVLVSDDGTFDTILEVNKDTQEIVFVATSRAGKETKINREIKVE